MSITTGSRVGPYEVTSQLGQGGMGVVYRARDTQLQRQVALKLLPDHFANDADRLSRFEREAQVLASLNHPNIAQIYGLEKSGNISCIVMELVEGETLADRLKRGPIPLDEVVQISKQIVDAVETAHERGIVHRDLKPGNIKIAPDGKLKVLDFGLAKVTSNASPAAAPEAFSNSPTLMSGSMGGIILGTAPYMSPEQARGKNVDARTDIWAFGCVLYEMLTSKQAFTGETTTDILARVLEGQPKWEALPAGTPSSIRVLLESTLSKDPKERLQHIGDARVFLNRPSALSEKSTTAAVHDRGGRRGWFAAAALALVLAAALVPATLYFMRTPPELPVMRFEMPAPGIPMGPGVGPLISPDGQRIAYVAANGGKRAIWIRALGSLTAQQLAGTENAASPFWAPDSRHLAFYADGKLKKTDVSGGGVQILCNAPLTVEGAWNSDGVILLGSAGPVAGIVRISDAGGDAVPVVSAPDASANPFQFLPQFLPDGRHFLFHATNAQTGNVYLASLDSKATTRLMGLPNFTPTGTNSRVIYLQGYLLFSRDRTLLAQPFDAAHGRLSGDPVPIAENVGQQFSASQTGVLVYRTDPIEPDQIPTAPSRLSWFDRKGKPAGNVSVPAVPGNFTLSMDGRVAMDNLSGGPLADVWVIDARGVPNKLTADNPNFDGGPIWSPDGQHVGYSASREAGFTSVSLYQRSSNGVGAAEPLLSANPGFFDFARDWRRNGIVFERMRPDMMQVASDIWLLSMPEKKPALYQHNGFVNAQAQVSPDGRYIAYVTNESGSYQVVVQTFPDKAGGKWPVTAQGGSEPLWKSDGRELYYLAPDGKIMAVAVKTDSTFQAGQASELFPTTLTPEQRPLARRYAVSADGQRFLIAAEPSAPVPTLDSIPITAVVNWTATLRKK